MSGKSVNPVIYQLSFSGESKKSDFPSFHWTSPIPTHINNFLHFILQIRIHLYTFNIQKNKYIYEEWSRNEEKRDETHVMKLELQIDFYLHNLSPWGIILYELWWMEQRIRLRNVKEQELDGFKKKVKVVWGNGRVNLIFMCYRF
jgi:hypothetical protein